MKHLIVILAAVLGTACAATPDGVIAQNELVALELERSANTLELRLVPAAGARINAQFKPALETATGDRIIFDSPAVTVDSEYFTAPPFAKINGASPINGTLLASVCPAGKQVCMSVKLPVAVK